MKSLLENKYFLVGFIALVIVFITGVTYAWYTYNYGNTNVAFEVDGIYVSYNGGSNISNPNLIPTSTKEKGMVKEVTVSVDKDVTPVPTFNLYLKVNTLEAGLNNASFKWELYKNGTYLNQGTFENVSVNDTLTLTTSQTISTTQDKYTLYIWIDGNMENPSSMYSQDFSFELYASGQNAILKEPGVTMITNLYTNATKTPVVNNNVTYQYAKDISMMADVAGNIRYYGADPDNYIYFNCDDYSNQTESTCEKWRIIGVFEGKVKIKRNSIIGRYSWDTSASGINDGNGINQWGTSTYSTDGSTYTGADLMKLLNPGYENNQDLDSNGNTITVNNSLYYTGGSGNCYNNSKNAYTTCNFSTSGLKNDTTRNLISETTYYLGGYNGSRSVYANEIYGHERGVLTGVKSPTDNVNRTTTWTGRIGLPYPSDYGYAADLSSCTKTLYDYDASTCTSTNWMLSSDNLLITPNSGNSSSVWFVFSSGLVHTRKTYDANGVVPVLYLTSDAVFESGTGDVNDPYHLTVS